MHLLVKYIYVYIYVYLNIYTYKSGEIIYHPTKAQILVKSVKFHSFPPKKGNLNETGTKQNHNQLKSKENTHEETCTAGKMSLPCNRFNFF